MCLLVDKFSPLKNITQTNYINLVHSMCVLKGQNKTQLSIFKQEAKKLYFQANIPFESKDISDNKIKEIQDRYLKITNKLE